MIRRLIFTATIFLFISFFSSAPLDAQISLDLESGFVSTGYNDVRIPGNQGTLFSLSKDLDADSKIYYRIRVNYKTGERHTFSLLYAPLTILSDGRLTDDISFAGVVFPANNDLNATYKFNSYRLTYSYGIVQKPKLEFDLGITAKIRDAKIAIASQNLFGEKVNVGFVPIINFRLLWRPAEKFGILLDGDALAAPQGRAEDVMVAATYRLSDRLGIKAGYRILEGGADNDEVYTFSLFHYASVGFCIYL